MSELSTATTIIPERVISDDSWFLERVGSIIKQKGKDPGFGVQQLAETLEVSRTQLNRKLMQLTKNSPGKMLLSYRLRMAAELLREGHQPVKEIAGLCGFHGHTSFCRNFFHEYGCSPSAFRKRHEEEQNDISFRWQIPFRDEDLGQLLKLAHQKPWLAELLRVVITNLGNITFTVEQLADALYLSPSSLHRKMKETFDVSPQRFIRDLKLQYAGELLAKRSGSVGDIAYKSGFFDHAHLCRCFKAAFGCRPSAYTVDSRHEISVAWLENKLMHQTGKRLQVSYK